MHDQTKAPDVPAEPADEFAGIRPARRRPSWWAIAVVLLSGFLIYHQRHDVIYALTSGVARPLGQAGQLFKNGQALPVNRYVRISGTPDFESAVILDTQGEWKFRSFFRLLETDRKLFVQRIAGPLPLDMVAHNSFAGRLVPLGSVSFSASIRAYFDQHITSTRVFDPAVFRAAFQDKRLPGALADKLGETVAIAGNQPLAFDVRLPQRYLVDVPHDRYEKLEDATAALTATGAKLLSSGKLISRESSLSGFSYECEFPKDRERAVLSAVVDLGNRTRVEPVVRSVVAPLSQLQPAGNGFAVVGASDPQAPPSIAWDDLTSVRVATNLTIPEDAFLLLEGERPSAHYKSVVATAFLLAFALVNLMAVRRRL
ncbi:MAG: hypothetical protein SF187_26950 [Deltaproteobacteria bacterium]|nr:hypothetical protein [Deltaproteobacteria bacterium]